MKLEGWHGHDDQISSAHCAADKAQLTPTAQPPVRREQQGSTSPLLRRADAAGMAQNTPYERGSRDLRSARTKGGLLTLEISFRVMYRLSRY